MSGIFLVGYWVAIGTFCLVAEFAVSGIGLLFLGLGGLTNAILVYNFTIFAEYQYASFGLLSFIWLLILWWPLQKYVYKTNPKAQSYIDIIGAKVEVCSPILSQDDLGQVKWSGTILNAKLDETELIKTKAGDKLRVKSVQGNILICSR